MVEITVAFGKTFSKKVKNKIVYFRVDMSIKDNIVKGDLNKLFDLSFEKVYAKVLEKEKELLK